MVVETREEMAVESPEDVIRVRQRVRGIAVGLGFSLVDQTKVVTAASEIARNTVVHGGGGRLLIEALREGARPGLRLTFSDSGPGIADIERALTDGYSSASGLGLGLGGAKRLSHEFAICSASGEGTQVILTRWK